MSDQTPSYLLIFSLSYLLFLYLFTFLPSIFVSFHFLTFYFYIFSLSYLLFLYLLTFLPSYLLTFLSSYLLIFYLSAMSYEL
jgi:hypothetical protein